MLTSLMVRGGGVPASTRGMEQTLKQSLQYFRAQGKRFH